ncbi:FAD-binding oxidoreductase [Pigmentiphaga litoralis]|uniref:4-cresol dehydrogenase (Hydroxylating) n=1 Tax=Pigmentiphaga litoralis TaxID=516702 RepID=A0A7Y9ITJ3_9BURK|nr:FAD-binding oxidoreductase [Pigmentiphaga litoralis]NYE23559.1 4-cresol dehydrogenase (hydroxylating) [Pigmentiphaga litoralis]NYE82827.1 4-cresol dehydrogenase (hydroxylating) [Pigmentiphaga litoralis]
MSAPLNAFVKQVQLALGDKWVDQRPETLARYGEHTLPATPRLPSAVVFPGSTADVQAIVAAANDHAVPLYPISTGNNIGLGSRAPTAAGQVVVDLGYRMNRILEINDEYCYAEVEPGVSFQMLHDELSRRGDKLMISATSGPPHGGILGNALDRGAGYGPYFDHFGMLCGMEVVLGSGQVLRTGDGSLDTDNLLNWHVSKYSFGPALDGLFTQSNFGIVTRSGVWLMPRPPAARSFHFIFENDDDLAEIIDLCRPLKLSNFVPTLFRVTNDLYALGTEARNPEYLAGSRSAISDTARRDLQKAHGLGAWQVSGMFYGASDAAIEPQIQRVRAHFERSGNARFVDHDQAMDMPPLRVGIDAMTGRPGILELGMLQWRPGSGNSWFLPGTPMSGRHAIELDHLGRQIFARHGMDYIVMHVASARFARGLHVLVWNKDDADENARADACYRELTVEFAKRGVGVGRAPVDYQAMHMEQMMPALQDVCRGIKRALDPNNIIAPGKYGIL